jgi:hypothetical protein
MTHCFHPAFIFTCNNTRRMFEAVTNSTTARRFLLLAGLAGTMLLGYGSAFAQNPTGTIADGQYKIIIRGYYSGDGTASVVGGVITIDAAIKDDNGLTGTLHVDSISLVGDHFKGTGTIMGGTTIVSGRVEAADPAAAAPPKGSNTQDVDTDRVVSDARIGATFKGPFNHQGRIAGARVTQGQSVPGH